jgi:hypothetical protein
LVVGLVVNRQQWGLAGKMNSNNSAIGLNWQTLILSFAQLVAISSMCLVVLFFAFIHAK